MNSSHFILVFLNHQIFFCSQFIVLLNDTKLMAAIQSNFDYVFFCFTNCEGFFEKKRIRLGQIDGYQISSASHWSCHPFQLINHLYVEIYSTPIPD